MPRPISHSVLEDTDIELSSESRADYTPVKLTDTENTLLQLAGTYIELINEEIERKDIASSGFMQDNITPTDLEKSESTLSVGINAPLYASYVDEGVNGWAVDRGSRFKFRTKGVNPKGDMVNSLKSYIEREGLSSRNVKVSVTSREAKGKTMRDASTKAAVQMAYMIKRHGIRPRHFWSDATKTFLPIAEKELGVAVKIDIINNLVP